MRDLPGRLDQSDADVAATVERIAALEFIATQLASSLARLHDHVVALTDVVDRNSTWSAVSSGTQWASAAPLEDEPTISVVLPTRNRSSLLSRAVGSVLAQSYPNWELVIIDDGSIDDTNDTVGGFVATDTRIRTCNSGGIGGGGARNAGLDIASGSIVTFLDDDNVMTPHWLRAVADYMSRVPACAALYGAQLRLPTTPDIHTPVDIMFVSKFDPTKLQQDNYIDLGVVAVRAGHAELRFDPTLKALQDWEMIVRIAETTPLTPLPALASCYSLTANDRISDTHGGDNAVAAMRQHFAARRSST